MKRYYIPSNKSVISFETITEDEWVSLMGDKEHKNYADKVYCGAMTIDEVPEEYRNCIRDIIANKIARWGEYHEQPISSTELRSMIEEVV